MSKEKKNKEPMSSTKKFVSFCLINGVLWVWCSYILAFLDKMSIAESFSQIAITEIIGVFLTYAIKSLFENLSKNNKWPDKNDGCCEDEADDSCEADEDLEDIDEDQWDNAKGDEE